MKLDINFPNSRDADLVDAEVTTVGMTYLGFVARNEDADDLTQVAVARIDNLVTGMTIIKWSNGTQNFDNAWANRASLTYTHLTE